MVGESDTKGGDGALTKQRRERGPEGRRGEGVERRGQEGEVKATRQKANKMFMSLLELCSRPGYQA